MSTNILANFKFHPVGQGCFYTGRFSVKESASEFNFVYDCGAKPKNQYLTRSIAYSRRRTGSNDLDLLFISHWHEDHVNGIIDLLLGRKCKMIYLPFLSPTERLFLALSNAESGQNTNNDPFNYLSFLASPHEFLQSIPDLQIEKICYIFKNSPSDFSSSKSISNFDITNSLYFEIDSEFLEDLAPEDIPLELISSEGYTSGKIQIKKGNNAVLLGKFWEFYMYFKSGKEDNITNYHKQIELLFGFKIVNSLSDEQLKNILFDTKKFKILKRKFKETIGIQNYSSLIVQHKPINFKQAEVSNFFRAPKFDIAYRQRSLHRASFSYYRMEELENELMIINTNQPNAGSPVITLLTGDIKLDQIDESKYIKDSLKHLLVFQVPHHGSFTGWETDKLKLFEKNTILKSVINFGYGNTHQHPRPEVLDDLIKYSFDIFFVNQFELFCYLFNLEF